MSEVSTSQTTPPEADPLKNITLPEAEQDKFRRLEYTPPVFLVPDVKFNFELNKEKTLVSSEFKVITNPGAQASSTLELDGDSELKLESITLNSRLLRPEEYQIEDDKLLIEGVQDGDQLGIVTSINPAKNQSGEGLYLSEGTFCTQMEATGFRKVSFFPDRPDVMSKYTTTLVADKSEFPDLISNGNVVEKSELDDGRHSITFNDPFAKPSYLFALVAGKFGVVEDSFITQEDRTVKLSIYVEPGEEHKCNFAMQALKDAMKWDEDTYGLAYDLDEYKIVAVSFFNAGAMENKGLNIFNSKCVLADPKTATDTQIDFIIRVVAHEYAHNWTGNRTTCRDWFQLTLKEGLTVFRDQQFSEALDDPAIKRIAAVRSLKNSQFPEDAGTSAHPIRPDEVTDMDNLYTDTVYSKGAEVCRMVQTLIGVESFKAGIAKYFELYDGQAVTCDEFINAMEIVSGRDLSQFMRWYSQAGTPVVQVIDSYDEESGEYQLTVKQYTPETPDGSPKEELHLPFALGLITPEGEGFKFSNGEETTILEITEKEQTFSFSGLSAKPIPSLFRGFSAPVMVDYNYSFEDLLVLLEHDPDAVTRFNASERIALEAIDSIREDLIKTGKAEANPETVEAFGSVLQDRSLSANFKAYLLTTPGLYSVASRKEILDYETSYQARDVLYTAIAEKYEKEFSALYQELSEELTGRSETRGEIAGKRALKNLALSALGRLKKAEYNALALEQLENAENMTDEVAALGILTDIEGPEKEVALDLFYERWKKDPIVMDKWLGMQALSVLDSTLETVKQLEERSDVFDINNPNRVKSLYLNFAFNKLKFHDPSGAGYEFLGERIKKIDAANPSLAASLAQAFDEVSRLPANLQDKMKSVLEDIMASKPSDNVRGRVADALKILE